MTAGAGDPQALMLLHEEALFTHDARGRLLRVNEVNGAGIWHFPVAGEASHCCVGPRAGRGRIGICHAPTIEFLYYDAVGG